MTQKSNLPYRADTIQNDKTKEYLDSIMIHPHSRGTLNAGEGSKEKPHKNYKVVIEAPNRNGVEYEEILLGSKDHHTVTVEVRNYGDSPVFAHIQLI